MRITLLYLSLSVSLFGQTLAPTQIVVEMTKGLNRDATFGNLDVGMPPQPRVIAVTASGAWTATVSGTITTSGDFSASMISISPTSGSGNGTITVTFDNLWPAPVGTYTGAITVGSAKVAMQIRITPRWPVTLAVAAPGGCTNTDQRFIYADACGSFPADGSQPAVGASFTGLFGNAVKRITSTDVSTHYSARSAWSRDGVLLMLTNFTNGAIRIINESTLAEPFASPPGNASTAMWSGHTGDAVDTYYYMAVTGNRAQIRRVVGGSTDTMFLDLSVSPYNLNSAISQDAGGTGGMQDSWMVAGQGDTGGGAPPSAGRLCAVNVATTSAVCTAAGVMTSLFPGGVDFSLVSPLGADGKRYVVTFGLPAAAVFVIQSDRLELSHVMGQYNGNPVCTSGCLAVPHAALGLDESGEVVIVTNRQGSTFNQFSAYRLKDGPSAMFLVRDLSPVGPDTGLADMHFSCAPAVRRCSMGIYQGPNVTVPTNHMRELIVTDFRSVIRPGYLPTTLPTSDATAQYYASPRGSLSPDGKKFAFAARWNGTTSVFVMAVP